MVFVFCVLSAQESDGAAVQTTGVTDETEYVLAETPTDTGSDGQNVSSVDTVWPFVRMVLVLALVILCIYFFVRILKKAVNPGPGTDTYLKKTASLVLSPGKSVHVITLNDTGYIVGVSDNSVNLIAEIADKELIDAMNLQAERNAVTGKARDFASLLTAFLPGKKQTRTASVHPGSESNFAREHVSEQLYTDVADETSELLRQQRERLRRVRSDNGEQE
jgi:flagellar protein FliO/FliZ